MDWLTDNFIANMYGPHFLLLYGIVIVLTLAACWWTLRQRDPTASLPVPLVPSDPDPYEIAYLRGGENQVTRVVIISLTQRGYLRMTEEKKWWGLSKEQRIEHAPNPPDPRHLSQIEREMVVACFSPLTPKEIFHSGALPSRIKEYCIRYEQQLHSQQLLMPPEVPRPIKLAGMLVILGLGGYKLIVALVTAHYNVFYLIVMGFLALGILNQVCSPSLSSRGRAYLEQLERAFEWLKEQALTVTPAAGDMTLPLLVGLFGLGVLAGTPLDYYQQMFQRGSSGGFYGGCGSGCGGGGGGGCGGGCGGCGG